MKTILAAFNARYSHSSPPVRYLEKYNSRFDIEIMEFSINDNLDSVYRTLLKSGADVYCFSCYIWNIEIILKIAQRIKLAIPDTRLLECLRHLMSFLYRRSNYMNFLAAN